MKTVVADLHVHTCLSPCASLEMTPQNIVQRTRESSTDVIAVCDHNIAENVQAVQRASVGAQPRVLPGLEVTTAEEVHMLGLFERTDQALSMQELIYDHLPPDENDENRFGPQVVANDQDEVEGMNVRLLAGAVSLSVSEVVDAIHDRGGIAIASHVDREAFGIVGQLGFVPPDLELDGVEVSRAPSEQMAQELRDLELAVITSSDAHRLDEIGSHTTAFLTEDSTLSEIRMALKCVGGRKIISVSV